jgi:L-asparaginase
LRRRSDEREKTSDSPGDAGRHHRHEEFVRRRHHSRLVGWSAEDLICSLPVLSEIADLEIATPCNIPGASLTLNRLVEVSSLVERRLVDGCDGAVIVQGTDTIEEAAFVLDLLVHSDKPVVVTGAMRGPQSAGADGPANLVAAVRTATNSACRDLGVVVVLNDEIHAARFVQKTDTCSPSAIGSPGYCALGRVVEGRVRLALRPQAPRKTLKAPARSAAPVALITVGLGEDGRMLKILPAWGYRGAVIEAMGAGHVPADIVAILTELAASMPVVLSTRVPSGPVLTQTYGFPGSEMDLLCRGIIPCGSLGGLKARLLLSLLLCQDDPQPSIDAWFGCW